MRLLIEGWRGVHHSFAMVNQFQILSLLKRPGLRLFHRDLPMPLGWTPGAQGAGLSVEDSARIAALGEMPPGEAMDAVYRICSPFRSGAPDDARRTISFMVTELGLGANSFVPDADRGFFTRDDNLVVTPSAWSRDRLAEAGIDPGRIRIVPHGVDASSFRPLDAAQRAAVRARLGFAPEEVVLLNIGGPFWNKGIDLLLEAFAHLRARGVPARLMLKDQSALYGVGVGDSVAAVGARCPSLLRQDTLAAISLVPGALDLAQLRELYGAADAYVSPYRAEGFNLPVLEAIAAGLPVIVTEGGATDGFCPSLLATRLPARPGLRDGDAGFPPGRFLEPSMDALVEAMAAVRPDRGDDTPAQAGARAALLGAFSWDAAAEALLELAAGGTVAVPPPAAPPPSQAEVLALLARMHPHAMRRGRKTRIGNAWDGGYVLPEIALEAGVVLSIGVGNDVSFDLELAKRGAQVLQFDHTVEGPPAAHANFRFHRAGWGPASDGLLLSFADLHGRATAVDAPRRLLKFDVEGAEYAALDAIDPDQLAAYEVIVCELHDLGALGTREMHDRLRRCLDVLTRHHAPVHLHANNYAGMALVQGVPVPQVVELTLLRRDMDEFDGPSSEPMPGPLDRPNHPLLPDLCLTPFRAAA